MHLSDNEIERLEPDELDRIACKVREAQIVQLFRQTWTGLVGVLGTAYTICFVLWPVVPHGKLSLWAAFMTLVTLGRGVLTLLFHRKKPDAADMETWARLQVAGVVLSGLSWALPSFFLWPEQVSVYQLVWPICILPLSAAAVVLYYTWKPSYIPFIFISLVPIALRFFSEGGLLFSSLGMLVLFYIAMLIHAGESIFASSKYALETGFRNEALSQHLSEEKLKVEDLSRRQSIIEQERSQAKLWLILQTAMDGFWLMDLQGNILEVNNTICRQSGYSTAELLQKNIADLGIVAGSLADSEHFRKVVRGGEERFESQLRHKDGKICDVEISAQYRPIGGGRIAAFMHDITKRKRADKALLYSNSLVSAAIESAVDGILIVDREGKLARWNQKFVTLWQIPEQLLAGDEHPVLSHVAAQVLGQEEFLARVQELYEHPEMSSQDLIHLSDGRLFDRYSQPLRIGAEIVGRFWSFRDITEKFKSEKEHLKMEKLESLGVLAGGIAHDFNNILTGVMGNISFAQLFLDAGHRSFKPLVEAEKAAKRATELAHQLLTFARGGDPVKKVISVQHLIAEAVSLMLHGSNVMAQIDIEDAIHTVDADEGQMSQVFHNIIINAMHAMPEGGTLAIAAGNETLEPGNSLALPGGSYIRVTVTDQGCGIPEESLERIFDPYFTTKSGGSGLGLASVNSIIKKHEGHIAVSSVVGRGTTFTIHLRSTGEAAGAEASAVPPLAAAGKNSGLVLLMDDEEFIRSMTSEMLGYLGYRATTCLNGTDAVALYRAALDSGAAYSAVIMDLTIPGGMGGREAAAAILAIDPDARLIVSSGYSNDPVISDYQRHGFRGAVTKPYNIGQLEKVLGAVIAG